MQLEKYGVQVNDAQKKRIAQELFLTDMTKEQEEQFLLLCAELGLVVSDFPKKTHSL